MLVKIHGVLVTDCFISGKSSISNEDVFNFLGSPIYVIPAIGACPALDTGAGIYKHLKSMDQ